MLFNSFQFLVFLPVVFTLYWFVFRGRRVQNLFVVVASYVFYGWWDVRFLGLIALTSLCSFASGLLIERAEGKQRLRRLISATNIVINLAILGYFKYYNFFVDNLAILLRGTFGYELDALTSDIILPVGISFYTFQALSYTIDVYRRHIRASHDVVEFFAYISFFPQLVAGPIERSTNLLPQFQRDRHFDYSHAVDGLRQMLWGFVKKLIVADNCASVVNLMWDRYEELPGVALVVLGVLFSVQIYCDFSGYSDIAIGCSRLFGIDLKRNFAYPYFARSVPEFWRRWHISLVTWLRDYVYIPLGGNRCSRGRVIFNMLVVWLVCGLWHGANWTYVCWGLYQVVLLAAYMLLGLNTKHDKGGTSVKSFSLVGAMQIALTFALTVPGMIIFRADNMRQAWGFLSRMFLHLFDSTPVIIGKQALLLCAAMLLVEWLQRDKQHALQFDGVRAMRHPAARYACYGILLVALITLAGEVQTFIYFQF